MKKMVFFSVLFVATLATYAHERSEAEMQQIAVEQLSEGANYAKGTSVTTSQMAVRELASADMYRIYGAVDGNGFVVVSNDDAFEPVLGYSMTAFDAANMPDGLRWWLEKINESLQWRKANGKKAVQVSFTPVENFVMSQWGQGSPYNYLCPVVDSQTSLTGCVATALGQILYFYKYPESSTGTCGYTLDGSSAVNSETLSTVYDWDNIRDTYPSRFYLNSVKKPVAELVRDCGYAVYMDYSPTASGAIGYRAPAAFVNNFRFQEGYIRYAQRDYYSDEEWQTVIYRELAAKRPVFMSGVDNTSGGHAFVLSGIDDNGKVYVNWGWDGTADGYFDIADMAPTGIQGSSGTDHFNSDQEIVYQITPNPTSGMEQQRSLWCTYNENSFSLSSSSTNYVTIGRTTLLNFHYETFSGKIVLLLTAEDGTEYAIDYYTPTSAVDVYRGVTLYSRSLSLSSIPAGTYTACLATKATADNKYWAVRSLGGICAYTLKKEASGLITMGQINLSTGIQGVASSRESLKAGNMQMYNLGGQRVGTGYKGIVIQNGKKRVLK